MSEQVKLDRYDGTGLSLRPVIQRLDQTPINARSSRCFGGVPLTGKRETATAGVR